MTEDSSYHLLTRGIKLVDLSKMYVSILNKLKDLIDYQQFPKKYVKKTLVFRPRKVQDKIEFADDVPRRWKENESPLKDSKYYERKRSQELATLRGSFP